jgi:NAD(P)H-dependent FMN reductase
VPLAGKGETATSPHTANVGRMPRLLVVHHSPTRSMRALTDQLVAGANDDAVEDVEVAVRPALEATAEDLRAADGYVLATPANFGYMSGALKHMFDSTFLHVGGALADDGSAGEGVEAGTAGRPFGLLVHGRYDTEGAVRSVLSIVQALRWRQSADVVAVLGDLTDADGERAYELGGTIAALLTEASE